MRTDVVIYIHHSVRELLCPVAKILLPYCNFLVDKELSARAECLAQRIYSTQCLSILICPAHPRYPAHSHRTTSCWCWFVSLLHMHTWAIAVAKHSAAEWGEQQSTTAASSTCARPSTQSNTKYTDVSENVLELSKLLRTRLSNRRSPGKKAICHRPVEKGAPRMGKWPGAFGVSGSLFLLFFFKSYYCDSQSIADQDLHGFWTSKLGSNFAYKIL